MDFSRAAVLSKIFLAMNSSEKLCLQWNDFKENITFSFSELREDKDFSDVTLACEDGKEMEAHKTVLASCSPFFKELLKRNKHPHPLILMRGVKSNILAPILDFLYYGEANIIQEDLDFFLALAGEFQLKGLSGSPEEDQQKKPQQNSKFSQMAKLKPQPNFLNGDEIPKLNDEIRTTHDYGQMIAMADTKTSVQLHDLDEKIRSMITKSDISEGPGKGPLATCNVCGKQGSYRNMPKHVEANHITGVMHSCGLCGKTFGTRNALNQHKRINHNGNFE